MNYHATAARRQMKTIAIEDNSVEGAPAAGGGAASAAGDGDGDGEAKKYLQLLVMSTSMHIIIAVLYEYCKKEHWKRQDK